MEKQKILAVVGPTSSGKTSLAIRIAKYCNGEIVSADSRQVYRGLDLGTGKVTQREMEGIPHHLLDVADPHDTYTVSDFVRDARRAIADIHAHGNLPIIAGGTFLYIDTLLGKISVPEVPPNQHVRKTRESLSATKLYELLQKKSPEYASRIDRHNPRRLIRALEIIEALGYIPETNSQLLYDTLTLGISLSTEKLRENIHLRLLKRIEEGMLDEVRQLNARGLSFARLENLGLEYRYITHFLQHKIDYTTMLLEIETKSWQFAKRQMTWLKRDKNIVWIHPDDVHEVEQIVEDFLRT